MPALNLALRRRLLYTKRMKDGACRAAGTLSFALGLLPLATACTGEEAAPVDLRRPEALYAAERCADCHARHYSEWSASMHAYASLDPVFLAMNRRGQEETNGALGSFCVNCHAPMAVRTGATTDGLNLEELPAELQGVTCYFCHNAASVEGDHNNPVVLSDDVTMRARISAPIESSFHRTGYSSLLDGSEPDSSALCGACHDIVLPSPPAPAPVALERTFAEWKGSVFAPENAPAASAQATCNACHMPVSAYEPIAPRGPARERHSHHFGGVDVPLTPFPSSDDAAHDAARRAEQAADRERVLDPTLRIEICLQVFGTDASAVHVTLDNAAAGHAFPSGAAQDRRAFVELVAYAGERVLYESGVVEDGEDVTKLVDPDLWLFRDVTFDANGEPAHMFWDVARLEQRTIKAQVTADPTDRRYYDSHAVRRYPLGPERFMPGVPDRVSVRVRITPIGLDVLDDLVESGHLEPAFRAAMPTLDLLPHRRLAVASDSPLARLQQVSMEYSAATLASPLFERREDFTEVPSRTCVSMPRR